MSTQDAAYFKLARSRGRTVAKELLKAYERLFKFWKTEYDSAMLSFKKPRKRLRYFKARLLRDLRKRAWCEHKITARTCTNILKSYDSLWNFFEIPHVPPTNNHAERQLRPLVISKKLTFGTQSERGSRFIERIFSVFTKAVNGYYCDGSLH
jgi:transposase